MKIFNIVIIEPQQRQKNKTFRENLARDNGQYVPQITERHKFIL